MVTCNRVELYGVGNEPPEKVLNQWGKLLDLKEHEKQQFYIYESLEALDHLFRVTASLESMVIGETQITGQVKRAYEKSVQSGLVGPILHKCFQQAFKVAKRVRRETEVGRLAVSIPSIGVKLAEKVLGNLSNKTIAVLGLGEIGRNAAEHFATVQPQKLILYNRTRKVAEEVERLRDIQGERRP